MPSSRSEGLTRARSPWHVHGSRWCSGRIQASQRPSRTSSRGAPSVHGQPFADRLAGWMRAWLCTPRGPCPATTLGPSEPPSNFVLRAMTSPRRSAAVDLFYGQAYARRLPDRGAGRGEQAICWPFEVGTGSSSPTASAGDGDGWRPIGASQPRVGHRKVRELPEPGGRPALGCVR